MFAKEYVRDICSWKLLQMPIRLRGRVGLHPNVCQIDEFCFSHKPKHHRGHPARHPVWVFGIVDTSTTPATGYMEVVQRRDAATLLPIIQAHVLPNTTIHSDEWRAYHRAIQLPNIAIHQTVNHSYHFRDPATGVHTNHIESYWNRVKLRLKRMKGCHRHMLPSYLDEIMWRERYGKPRQEGLQDLVADIAARYPVPH
ncbi:uncharacterized protein LOC134185043 [Corticium candelabrum]|uniref:uncharacterized protein LOC134185043 n=1 Tax=Corticium candelabrum TaxID=121492 RepID=UPI002E339F39|nr:uncharacterized protein LOC134185043 [Corticium candelabrum]